MPSVAIIGGGPAGLMAAEILSKEGVEVSVFEKKPSLGRKLLMAGRGGLNLTHSEPLDIFMTRYGIAQEWLAPAVNAFPPQALRDWCNGLGEATFAGSSGRVFPKSFKASPLLRAWQTRLAAQGVRFYLQHTWQGWNDSGALVFTNAHDTPVTVAPDATLLALGGASWPKLGSDGTWAVFLEKRNVALAPFRAANCGFETAWSEFFKAKYAGQPLKSVRFSFGGKTVEGEAMIAERGIEGGAIYALSSLLREALAQNSPVTLALDLKPGMGEAEMTGLLGADRAGQSLSNFLRKQLSLSPVAIGLLNEDRAVSHLPPGKLAVRIKQFPLPLTAPFGIDRAISSAGGVTKAEVDADFMLKKLPGVFVAGEMLDWEAPTGGYLLQATFSTAVSAAKGILAYLRKNGEKR